MRNSAGGQEETGIAAGPARPILSGIGRAAIAAMIAAAFAACARVSDSEASAVPGEDEVSPDAVMAVARQDFPTFIGRIPAGLEARYGFRDSSELSRVQVSTPFRVHTIDVVRGKGGPVIAETIRPLDEWRVPPTVDGRRRALLTVVRTDGRLEAVDFGAAGLAEALDALDGVAPDGEQGPRFLLRIIHLRRDFLGIPIPSEGDRFYPVSISPRATTSEPRADTGPTAPDASPAPYYSRSGIVALLKARIKSGAL